MRVTRPVQLGGFFVRENDSPTGDPAQATRVFNRPMKKGRVLLCLRGLLQKVAGVPAAHLHRYGVSSLRKFLPEIGKKNGLDTPRSVLHAHTSFLYVLNHHLPGRASCPEV